MTDYGAALKHQINLTLQKWILCSFKIPQWCLINLLLVCFSQLPVTMTHTWGSIINNKELIGAHTDFSPVITELIASGLWPGHVQSGACRKGCSIASFQMPRWCCSGKKMSLGAGRPKLSLPPIFLGLPFGVLHPPPKLSLPSILLGLLPFGVLAPRHSVPPYLFLMCTPSSCGRPEIFPPGSPRPVTS